MTYKTKLDFIKNEDRGIKRIGRIEYKINEESAVFNQAIFPLGDRALQRTSAIQSIS